MSIIGKEKRSGLDLYLVSTPELIAYCINLEIRELRLREWSKSMRSFVHREWAY